MRRGDRRAWVGVVLLALTLPGCPLTDDYYVAVGAGSGGAAVTGGAGGTEAGGTDTGGTDTGGTETGGTDAGAPATVGTETGGTDAGGTPGVGGGAGWNAVAGRAGRDEGPGGRRGEPDGPGGRDGRGPGGPSEAGMTGGPCMPEPEICDGVSNDCDDEIDEDGACPTGCTGRIYADEVYVICLADEPKNGFTYAQAIAGCVDTSSLLGFDVALAWLGDADENAFAKAWAAEALAEGRVWIGANDIDEEGVWKWGHTGGTQLEFFEADPAGGGVPFEGRFNDFAEGQPNNSAGPNEDCAALRGENDWQWNDVDCELAQVAFLCEQRPAGAL